MHIYGVFREDGDSYYGTLCCHRDRAIPALFAAREDAVAWAAYIEEHHSDYTYAVHKFNLNPNGFTSERIYYPPAAGDSPG